MVFAFGKKIIHIDGEKAILDQLHDGWKSFFLTDKVSVPIDAFLCFEEMPSVDGDLCSDGWNVFPDKKPSILYALNHEPLFAMEYRSCSSRVKVYVDGTNKNNVRLAAQYSLMLALHHDCIGLHGVTLLCGDEILILSAPSGTGKTTLAHLLEEYREAIVINGDFALLSCSGNGVFFEPTPFCGSSGRCLNHRVRIDRVVFLSQSLVNQWDEAKGREAMINLMSNVFIPSWDADISQTLKRNIISCVSHIGVNDFSFAPTKEAAEMFFDKLSKK